MRTLLLGGRGSIGRRYEAILKFLEKDYFIFDIADRDSPDPKVGEYYLKALGDMNRGDWDKAIVCTPTDSHYSDAKRLLDVCRVKRCKKDILIEKPVSKSPREIADLDRDRIYMVCNYKYALMGRVPLKWTYYNTGRDGLYWDLIQLLYINPELEIDPKGIIWTLETNEGEMSYREVEQSYYDMILSFLCKPQELWTMKEAMDATNIVKERYIKDGQNS